MKSKTNIVWLILQVLFVILVISDELKLFSAILPLAFITMSFLIVNYHPTAYRVIQLIFNIQILFYYLFQLALNYSVFLPSKVESGFSSSFMSHMQIDSLLTPGYAYIIFIILYFMAYLPYFVFKNRKNKLDAEAA